MNFTYTPYYWRPIQHGKLMNYDFIFFLKKNSKYMRKLSFKNLWSYVNQMEQIMKEVEKS